MLGQILIVEDDGVLASMVTAALREQGMAVEHAATCEEARALALKQPPDLLVLDIGLPDGDGWTLLRELRAGPLGPHVPVVVVSSGLVTRRRIRCLGIQRFIPKPFSVPYFTTTIKTLFDQGQR